jgi:hypothetical protein
LTRQPAGREPWAFTDIQSFRQVGRRVISSSGVGGR